MITRLHLMNFRRHEDTEITFSPDSQIVLISGGNGAGKTTILEGILYAFYGQGRHGRRNLDTLVRRGAGLEGMQVQCDFTLGGTEHSIVRRREGKAASAILYGNGLPLVEGNDQVSAEVTRMLGMDAAGFKLAVIAQQKELDGLASLKPAERAAMLSRLLRLDVVTRAKDEARRQMREQRGILTALGKGEDLPSLEESVKAARASLEGSLDALQRSSEELVRIDADLATSAAVDAAWSRAQTEMARAEGVLSAAQQQLGRLDGEMARLVIPGVVTPPERSLEELSRLSTEVERSIARAEAAKEVASQRSMLRAEESKVSETLTQVKTRQEEIAGAVGSLKEAEKRLAALRKERSQAADLVTELLKEATALDTQARILADRLAQSTELGPVCDRCGQEVSEEHRHAQEDEARTELAHTQELLQGVKRRGGLARQEEERLSREQSEEEARVRSLHDEVAEDARLGEQASDLLRRRDTYAAQIARLEVEEVDLEELYARRGEVAAESAVAQQALEASRARDAALARRGDLEAGLQAAREQVIRAAGDVERARVDADLELAYTNRQAALTRREEEMELQRFLTTEVAVSKERVLAAEGAVERARKALETRREHETVAAAAANASKVLEDVEGHLATQIRPALEGSITEVLTTLSEGRFTAVSVDTEYNITVSDDGAFRPLSEFSGGEMDLIALAVRLALASVVSDRQGGGGVGFLILDECFGSQDPARRESIMSALRNLRSVYGQILLISHVGGLEDSADAVIDVSVAVDEDGERVAEVSAA